jgi:hypothetical protein
MHTDNVISRPAAKKHAADNIEMDGARETDSFLPQQQQQHHIPHVPSSELDPVPMPRGLKSALKTIFKGLDAISKFFYDIGKIIYPYLMNNPPVAYIRGVIQKVVGSFLAFWLPIYNALPPESCMHMFTFVLVFTGVFTLFMSPMFRSKLTEMRLRPPSMENGIIDEMALSADRYNIIRNASAPAEVCGESHFRCEFYWTSETNDALDTQTTYYCTAYVCQGMTVTAAILVAVSAAP